VNVWVEPDGTAVPQDADRPLVPETWTEVGTDTWLPWLLAPPPQAASTAAITAEAKTQSAPGKLRGIGPKRHLAEEFGRFDRPPRAAFRHRGILPPSEND